MTGPTMYTEANAILAAQEGDLDEVQRILADMLPGERSRLFDACVALCGEIVPGDLISAMNRQMTMERRGLVDEINRLNAELAHLGEPKGR